MIIDLEQQSSSASYFLMTQTLVPRPIAWVLSGNDDDSYNLAPFSYFNAISSDPPLVMLSLGRKPDGSEKDTHRNLRERRHCTIHIASEQHLEALNESSASLAANESELDKLGLQTELMDDHPVPRLSCCSIAYACELADIQMVGNTPQAVIYLEVKAIHIDDDIVSMQQGDRIKVHADKLRPLSRLGSSEYMGHGEILLSKRPT